MQYTLVAIFKVEPKAFSKFEKDLELDDSGKYINQEMVDAMADHFSDKLDYPLSKFDINRKVKEYKYYLSEETKKSIAESYKIDISDSKAIADSLEKWDGDRGGVDEGGVYGLSTKNKQGKQDGWFIYGIMTTQYLINNFNKIDRTPHAILTPSCEWMEAPEYFFMTNPSSPNYNKLVEWEEKSKTILSEYSENSLSVLINCHV